MKTVIEMWHKAWPDSGTFVRASAQDLERFAELVRADERNSWPAEMEAMERQVNILTDALAAQRKPLTVDEAWQSDQLMSLNAELGCSMDLLMEVVNAIEAAHGIKEHK